MVTTRVAVFLMDKIKPFGLTMNCIKSLRLKGAARLRTSGGGGQPRGQYWASLQILGNPNTYGGG